MVTISPAGMINSKSISSLRLKDALKECAIKSAFWLRLENLKKKKMYKVKQKLKICKIQLSARSSQRLVYTENAKDNKKN